MAKEWRERYDKEDGDGDEPSCWQVADLFREGS
jgi:hypothetical protein